MANIKLTLVGNRATDKNGWYEIPQSYSVADVEKIPNPSFDSEDKVFTAVPSPLGRAHMYDMAFKVVAEKIDGDTIYNKMVSDVLDLLEILFFSSVQASMDDIIKVSALPLVSVLAKMEEDGKKEHKLMARTLNYFIKGPGFNHVGENFFLVYYGSTIIGASSPFSFFSPACDIPKILKSGNIEKGQLYYFSEKIVPLLDRKKEFIEFLYLLKQKYSREMQATFKNFISYLDSHEKKVENKLGSGFKESLFDQSVMDFHNYEVLSSIQVPHVTICGIPFYTLPKQDVIKELHRSPLKIKPSIPNVQLNDDLPIVLASFKTSMGTSNLSMKLPFLAPVSAIEERRLPDRGVQYPCIYPSDFLETNLIRVKYPLNDKFYRINITRNSMDNSDILLPLKPLFFKYFAPQDIPKLLSIEVKRRDEYLVKLKIPTKENGYVEYVRTFLLSIGSDSQGDTGKIFDYDFSAVFFPLVRHKIEKYNDFFKVMFIDAERADHLIYEDFKLSFFDKKLVEIPEYELRDRNHAVYSYRFVRYDKRESYGRIYYETNVPFEFIRIKAPAKSSAEEVYGIIYPQWDSLTKFGDERINVAVDFGTTNTFVALGTYENRTRPSIFTIKEEDNIVVQLNAPARDSAVKKSAWFNSKLNSSLLDINLPVFQNSLFIPSVIDENESEFSFPIRTVMSETQNKENSDDVFGARNIAFAYLKETSMPNEVYPTNLKWGIDRYQATQNRVRNFVQELLLIIRSKIIASGGDPSNSQLIWFYPTSLSTHSRDVFQNSWESQFSKIFHISQISPLNLTESQAPYYHFMNENELYGSAVTMVIDIGGGSTDISIFDKSRPIFGTSFYFAGNMIWNEEIVKQMASMMDNLVRTIPTHKQNRFKELQADALKMMKDRGQPYEYTNWLFSIDSDNGNFFSNALKTMDGFKISVLYAFSSIIYHCADLLQMRNVATPRFICLSGKGSKMLDVLDASRDNHNLNEFLKVLFNNVLKIKGGQLDILKPDKIKETTAFGGLHYSFNEVLMKSEKFTSIFSTGDGVAENIRNQGDGLSYESLEEPDPKLIENIINFHKIFVKTIVDDFPTKDRFGINLHRDFNNFEGLFDRDYLIDKYKFGFAKYRASIGGTGVEINQTLFFFPISECLADLYKFLNSKDPG